MLLCEIAIINKDYELAQSILDELYIYLSNNKAFHVLNLFDDDIVLLRDRIRNLRTNSSAIPDSLKENNSNTLLLSRQKIREELNIKYETEKKELENANLALKNEIAQDKINKTRINSIISLLLAFVLLGLILKLKKKNKAILKSESALKDQAQRLAAQNELLKQSEAFKAKLFSIISHDLKSPINSLKMIVEMSSERQLSKEDYDYLMENMKQELDITSNLLNDLLFWSKAQMHSNTIKWSYFNLFNTVSKCLNTLSININLKQLKIINHLSPNFIVWGDETRCEFVIRNILHNAIKYSDFYKEIEIGIKDNGKDWNFYINDNGIGISKEQLDTMFVNDNSRKSTKGTLNEQGAGIGLLLCHDFIESLGWSLRLNSLEGVGTTFHIFINKEKMNDNKPIDKLKLASPSHELQLPIPLN
jgi:signal transduction histidine kinase